MRAGIRTALRWGYVVVAVCLLLLGCSSRALAQDDEIEAMVAAEAAEAAAAAEVEVVASEAEAATEVGLGPILGDFTTAADDAVADSSQVIGPIANLTADPVLGDGDVVGVVAEAPVAEIDAESHGAASDGVGVTVTLARRDTPSY